MIPINMKQTNLNTSIFATHRIVAGEFNAISDERIKNIDGLSNSKQDLATLNEIEVTDYHMIDPSHGEKPVKKAIAQQLEKVYPQAVSKSTNCIPDIYKLADCKAGIIQIQNNLSSGERIRLIFENKDGNSTISRNGWIKINRCEKGMISGNFHFIVEGEKSNKSIEGEFVNVLLLTGFG